jgi:hypothetical protein
LNKNFFFFFLGIFTQQTGSISDENLTDFTPAGEFNRYHSKKNSIFLLLKVGHFQFGVSFIFGKQHG